MTVFESNECWLTDTEKQMKKLATKFEKFSRYIYIMKIFLNSYFYLQSVNSELMVFGMFVRMCTVLRWMLTINQYSLHYDHEDRGVEFMVDLEELFHEREVKIEVAPWKEDLLELEELHWTNNEDRTDTLETSWWIS